MVANREKNQARRLQTPVTGEVAERLPHVRWGGFEMLALIAIASASLAAAPARAPGRDPELLHKHVEQVVLEKEREQEQDLRRLLTLGGASDEQAEVTARLAAVLRQRGLTLAIRAQAEGDAGDGAAAEKDKAVSAEARTEAVARYRELLKKYPKSLRQDEALFFLADTLQDSGKDDEAVKSARELVKRFPKSQWAPASHVFIGEHLFEAAKLDEALAEYRAAAEVTTDEVYPYALYKAAWCRFNQSGFADAMRLLKQVVEVSESAQVAGAAASSKTQLAREARRDYVIAYARIGVPEKAREEFTKQFGAVPARKMLEQYGKLLFETGRDPEAQLIHRQLLAMHGDEPAAALDQTRLLILASRTGKRSQLLGEAKTLVETFARVRRDDKSEALDEANRLAEETLRNLVVQIHNEAKKTELDDTFAATKALYADYLTLFPDAPDAYDLRFFDGELLYGLKEKPQAAALYEAVVRQDLAAMKAGRKPGRWLQKAAWSAVLSRAEAAGDGDAKQKTAQRALSAEEDRLARSCLLYLEVLPEGPHAVEVAFKIGRLEYVAQKLDAAEKHLAWVATAHPEHELAEFSANLVLDISNLRHDYPAMHAWAVRFLGDAKLVKHGTLAKDLKRIEEESAYAIADGSKSDGEKAKALLAFVDAHPHADLSDKALFGASAALSRAGRIDEALSARARVWKELVASPLVPRAILASAADHSAIGDFGEAAALLEKYAAGFRKQEETKKWRREHPRPPGTKPVAPGAVYEEARAQEGLHDAAVLREARGELRQALVDRSLLLEQWKKAKDRDEALFAQAMLRSKLGELSRAARDLAEIARQAHDKPALRLTAWRESARLFHRLRETDHEHWAWLSLENAYKAVGPRNREKLGADASAAAAEAHLALGTKSFDEFRKQQIKQPLMATLNRKIALLQVVKKRAEETVAMRQAEPAVCALAELGEAQILLAQALATSPFPSGLNGEQKKLYRDAINEKAQPIFADARDTLAGADGKARELGVSGACASKTAALLEKLGGKPAPRPVLDLGMEALPIPDYVDADGQFVEEAASEAPSAEPIASGKDDVAKPAPDERAAPGERAHRLMDDALLAQKGDGTITPEALVERFRVAAEAESTPGPAHFDLAVSLERAGKADSAWQQYLAVAKGKGELAYAAAERLASIATTRGDGPAARSSLQLADASLGGDLRPAVLRAEVELLLGDAAAAQAAARLALAREPGNVRALCALARAHLAQGNPGTARILALRAAQGDVHDALPLVVQAEIARAQAQPAAELAAARTAVEIDADLPQAALALGRALYERGQSGEAVDVLTRASGLDPDSYGARLALGVALASSGQAAEAEASLRAAAKLAPQAAAPHLELARLKVEADGDAQAALDEAKLFLHLSKVTPPAGHPVHALVQRCEGALKQRSQASVVQGK